MVVLAGAGIVCDFHVTAVPKHSRIRLAPITGVPPASAYEIEPRTMAQMCARRGTRNSSSENGDGEHQCSRAIDGARKLE